MIRAVEILEQLVITNDSKLVLLVIDGLGGLPLEGKAGSELQVANTPHLDRLAARSLCGLIDPVGPGITPGSGPAHLALFGYDPIAHNIGRGILSALGVDFPLKPTDVAARINFATLDETGKISDRRAGRIPTELNRRLCQKLRESLRCPAGVHCFIETVSEHRAVLVLRGEDLDGDLADSDPQQSGEPPLEVRATHPRAARTAAIVRGLVTQARAILSTEKPANMILLRGFAKNRPYPSLGQRFKLRAAAIAQYPMYRGLTRLVGMEVLRAPGSLEDAVGLLQEVYDRYDYFYLHVKKTDSRGEDGDFDAKVREIETVDRIIPKLLELQPEVLMVTGDHSTPAKLGSHSWHPVPVLLHSDCCGQDPVDRFDEVSCLRGGLGRIPSQQLMALALANARRLTKFGA